MLTQLYGDRLGRKSVYVAGSSSEWETVSKHIEALKTAGLHVTHDWTVQVRKARMENMADKDYPSSYRKTLAWDDLSGVLEARFFWLVAPKVSSIGAWVELGAAMHAGKTIVISGDVSRCIFGELADFHFPTHESAEAFFVQHHGARRE
jgi:hypothetical protein